MPQSKKPETPIGQKNEALSKVLQKLQGEIKIVQTSLDTPPGQHIDVYLKTDSHVLTGGHLKGSL